MSAGICSDCGDYLESGPGTCNDCGIFLENSRRGAKWRELAEKLIADGTYKERKASEPPLGSKKLTIERVTKTHTELTPSQHCSGVWLLAWANKDD